MTTQYRIGVVTTSRADFGIYRSVLKALQAAPDLEFGLVVTGMHLSPEFGMTVREVEASGFPIWAKFEALLASDSPEGIAKSMGTTTLAAAQAFADLEIDLLVVLGDRFEMHAVALAALPFRMPVAHIHGGEETEGAIDNALRHSMTKLSHLHFCATELAAARISAMGEDPKYITVSGAPALDSVGSVTRLDRAQLAEKFGLPKSDEFALITFHPETLDPVGTMQELDNLCSVLAETDLHLVFTAANADTSGRAVNAKLSAFIDHHKDRAQLVKHMGAVGYFSAMDAAAIMVGNSSSGILEAASFQLPVVNIGDRQAGRERSSNVVDCAGDTAAIRSAISSARSSEFREGLASAANVYGDGNAAPRIVDGMRAFLKDRAPVRKRFHGIST